MPMDADFNPAEGDITKKVRIVVRGERQRMDASLKQWKVIVGLLGAGFAALGGLEAWIHNVIGSAQGEDPKAIAIHAQLDEHQKGIDRRLDEIGVDIRETRDDLKKLLNYIHLRPGR